MSRIIHIFWDAGWDNAPPKAQRNAEAWEQVGTVKRWSDDNARKWGFLHDAVTPTSPPAMRCDIVLANAQWFLGGLAVGADMAPLDLNRINDELFFLESDEARGAGMVVYGNHRSVPYNGFSYFPQWCPWMEKVREAHLAVSCDAPKVRDLQDTTGPRLWRRLITYNLDLWLKYVRTYHAGQVFSHEHRKNRGADRPWAWVDPGLESDWNGTRPEVWK